MIYRGIVESSKMEEIKTPCPNCSNNIQFPAEMLGKSVDCPHCGQKIALLTARPPAPSTKSVFFGIAVAFLIIGFLCTLDWSGDESFRTKILNLDYQIYGYTSKEIERDKADLASIESGRRFRMALCFGVAAVFFLAGTITASKP